MAKKLKPQAAPDAMAAPQQPYYLQRAHIKEFRSIRDVKVDFKPGLNIIIGPNGSGKTNFIKTLPNSLADIYNTNLGNTNEFIFAGPHLLQVKINRSRISDTLNETDYFINQNKGKWEASVLIDGDTYSDDDLNSIWFNIDKKNAANKKRQLSRPNIFLSINYGIPSEYQLVSSEAGLSVDNYSMGTSGHFTRFGSTILRGIHASVFNRFVNSSAAQAKLIEPDAVEVIINKVTQFILDRINDSLKTHSQISNTRFSDSLRIYANKTQNEILVKGLVMEFLVNDTWLPFTALSSGTQRLFYIISEVMAPRQFNLTDKNQGGYFLNEESQTILLEEPELGIHPDQLHRLLLFLREQSEKHQIIITTHSPQVLDMLNEDELDRITICELHKTKGTQFRKLKQAQIATARRYMKDVGFLSDYWRHGSLEERS